jgi:hypothetical protein
LPKPNKPIWPVPVTLSRVAAGLSTLQPRYARLALRNPGSDLIYRTLFTPAVDRGAHCLSVSP